MKIKSDDPQEVFCYHPSKCPLQGTEAKRIFRDLAICALETEKELLSDAEKPWAVGQDWGISEYPLGHFNDKEQLLLCTVAQLALLRKGFKTEIPVLEQLVFTTLECSFEAVSESDSNCECLHVKKWARLLSILLGVEAKFPLDAREFWDAIERDLFWDFDWGLDFDSGAILEIKEELPAFADQAYRPPKEYLCQNCSKPFKISDNRNQIFDMPPASGGFVYCVAERGGHFKVGRTRRAPSQRLRALQTANPKVLEICFAIRHDQPAIAERKIHRALQRFSASGEWFACSLSDARVAFESIKNADWLEC